VRPGLVRRRAVGGGRHASREPGRAHADAHPDVARYPGRHARAGRDARARAVHGTLAGADAHAGTFPGTRARAGTRPDAPAGPVAGLAAAGAPALAAGVAAAMAPRLPRRRLAFSLVTLVTAAMSRMSRSLGFRMIGIHRGGGGVMFR
jgi:hypothetical protein